MANENQLQLETIFVVTSNENEYREAAKNFVIAQDIVLDVGCKDGTITNFISSYCRKVVGIDHTEEAIKSARERYPGLDFELIDGFDVSKILRKNNANKYDIILINMSQLAGYSSFLDTICLLNMYATLFKPRVMIVHNKNLKSFVSRCWSWDPSEKGIYAAKKLQNTRATKFVGTRGVDEYRASIEVWTTETDNVLEIGCEWGTTTELIAPKVHFVLGTDISSKVIERAREKRPYIRFEVLDGFNIIDALDFKIKFDVIYIDISGLSGYRSLLDVISMLRTYEMILRPKAIIIKSGALKHFASHFIAWNQADMVNEGGAENKVDHYD